MRLRFVLMLQILILSLVLSASGEDVIYLKSDSTWRASEVVTQPDWFKPEYEPGSWGDSISLWSNNPCSAYCGKIKSCEVSCRDWMWYGSSCENCTRYFKKTVDVPGEVKSASITISGDDYYWLYVNGNFVGSDDNKLNAETYDVSGLLHEGVNIIAVKVENRREYEGVVVSGEVTYTGANKVITQLQEQVKTLESQITTLTEDKRLLQQRADSLDRELQARNAEARTLDKMLEEFRLANQSAASEFRLLGAELGDCKKTGKILKAVLVVLVAAVIFVGNHVYEKYVKKRKPTLSAVPIEKEEHHKKHRERGRI